MLVAAALHAAAADIPLTEEAPPGYNLVRERDAHYIADIFPEDVRFMLEVKEPTTVFRTRDARDPIGTLDAGQLVPLEGFTRFAFRVRGTSGRNVLVGWVNPEHLEHPEPEFHDKLILAGERREQVSKLIADRQIAIGMTLAEIRESRGDPTRRESRVTAEGREDLWEYIRYRQIPHYRTMRDPRTGAVYRQFDYYERIETSKVSIEFVDGVATSIAETEENTRRRQRITLAPPIFFKHL